MYVLRELFRITFLRGMERDRLKIYAEFYFDF